MNGVLQMMVVLLVFGPLIIGTLIWHIVWNNKSGPSSDPPSGGGPKRRPVPPPPRFSGDRTRRLPRLDRERPIHPQRRYTS
jgi:predicted anti-sigma-YlaC factor YlaD